MMTDRAARWENDCVFDRSRLADLVAPDRDLSPKGCEDVARAAAEQIDLEELPHEGAGLFELLWRNDHSEAWLNGWWQARDTGFHDHGGSCVGVFVIDGRVRNEALALGGSRRIKTYKAGESFSFPGAGIHRMDHEAGALTIHVYSPAIRHIGHYELIDGELRRTICSPDEESPPSPALVAALEEELRT